MELAFLDLLSKILKSGEKIAFEFRTKRDELLKKTTSSHYRRYIDPVSVIEYLINSKFEILYFVEGFGFAKLKQDDAHVCRILSIKK
jgi:hypothetical protein